MTTVDMLLILITYHHCVTEQSYYPCIAMYHRLHDIYIHVNKVEYLKFLKQVATLIDCISYIFK